MDDQQTTACVIVYSQFQTLLAGFAGNAQGKTLQPMHAEENSMEKQTANEYEKCRIITKLLMLVVASREQEMQNVRCAQISGK